jgi:hypothetical protein
VTRIMVSTMLAAGTTIALALSSVALALIALRVLP